jgi:hypothetical protein
MYIDDALLPAPARLMPNVFQPNKPMVWPIINGAIYMFATEGDQIAEHTHEPGQNHSIGVLHGSINYKVTNADGSTTDNIYTAPALLLVPSNVDHAVIAVSPPQDTSGPVIGNLATLSAVTVHLRMNAISPDSIKGNLAAIAAPIDDLIAKLTSAKALTV